MVMIESNWLTLCLVTETNQSHEMPYIAWVIRNRVERRDRFPNFYFAVITQPMQFSWFNDKGPFEDTDACFSALQEKVQRLTTKVLWDDAVEVSHWVTNAPRWDAPFGEQVDHYWSPVSMKPRGRTPTWASRMHRTFTPAAIDPERFVFAQETS